MDIIKLSAIEIRNKILNKELTCYSVVKSFIGQIKKNKKYNAVLEVFQDSLDRAKEIDKQIEMGFKGRLAGVPIIIKDNIFYKGKICSSGSNLLKNYVAEYNATVVEKLLNEGAIIIGRSNMDEFAMGSSTEKSAYGITHNPLDFERVPGGSSGGSACAVALNMCPIALGTDTGGSVRQPASYCGLYGIKPTYGRISRYGIVAYASALDQVGIFSRTIEDNALVLEILSGYDSKDMTSSKEKVDNYLKNISLKTPKLKVGIPKEVLKMIKGMDCEKNILNFINQLKSQNVEVVDVSIKNIEIVLSAYYIIAWAEASSNLARFNGVENDIKLTKSQTWQDVYKETRTKGFGKEVKRRIMLGNYVLSSGFYNDYYKKAKLIQSKLISEFENAFKSCDIIVLPTTTGEAFKIGSKDQNPVDAYKEDIFTVTINVVGVPSLNIPFGKSNHNMPLGIQLLSKKFDETKIYQLAKFIEQKIGG